MTSHIRRRFSPASSLMCACLSVLWPVLLMADEHGVSREAVEQQIQEADARLRVLDAEIAASRERKSALQLDLAANEARIGERGERMAELQRDIAAFDARLDELQANITDVRRSVTLRKQLLAEALRRSQRIAGDSGLKALLQHDDPALASRLGMYSDYALRAQRQAIAGQIDALTRIEVAAAAALKDRNWLNYIQKKATSQRDDFVATDRDQRRTLQAVDDSLNEKTRTVAELKADQVRLQTLMEELEQAPKHGSGYFAAGQGTWPLPVNGVIAARFGDTKSVGHITWDGLFIRSEAGRPVRAIADGEVVYSDWLNGFGMLVIVDHGDAWMSLYGGNREVLVDPGDWVDAGATIATVGDGVVGKGIVSDDGGHSAQGVYFEIRHQAEPVDPEDWVNTENGA